MTKVYIATECGSCPLFNESTNRYGFSGSCILYTEDIEDERERCTRCLSDHVDGIKVTIENNDVKGIHSMYQEIG